MLLSSVDRSRSCEIGRHPGYEAREHIDDKLERSIPSIYAPMQGVCYWI